MAETASVAEMANKVSIDLFKWFKWKRLDLMDQNFECHKLDKHTPRKKNHTHPVDVVFHYIDPYLNKRILLNTDLKSYAKDSIKTTEMRKALKSLAKTIDCARTSPEWKNRYDVFNEPSEIRGMLFIYNHDANYDKNFYYSIFEKKDNGSKPIRTESLPLEKNQQIHIIEPSIINYMTTLVADMNKLHQEGTFPETQYAFYYPDLQFHRTHSDKFACPATIETICSPYLIIEHDDIKKFDEKTKKISTRYSKGYVIYYNKTGASAKEFLYLLDTLSRLQILDSDYNIRIRVANSSYHDDIVSFFKKAISLYIQGWGFDESKSEKLNKIEFDVLETSQKTFSQKVMGWRNT